MIGDMETERVEALRRYAVLDTPGERVFEELAALARRRSAARRWRRSV